MLGTPGSARAFVRLIAVLIPGTTGFRTIKGARMHFPDYRAAEFIPLLQRHLRSHD
ncbi:MAG: hypothetical protein QOI01_527 [Mycobacterium sp.]|nr:hypothetical protein [Mycobacterium sp.]